MAILNLLLMHLIGRYCVFLSCVLLSWCSDAQTEGCASCVLWAVFGFALGCRGLRGGWRGGCASLLSVSPRYIRQSRQTRATKRRKSQSRHRPFSPPNSPRRTSTCPCCACLHHGPRR